MARYRVRRGHEFKFEGKTYSAGDVLELPEGAERTVGLELLDDSSSSDAGPAPSGTSSDPSLGYSSGTINIHRMMESPDHGEFPTGSDD